MMIMKKNIRQWWSTIQIYPQNEQSFHTSINWDHDDHKKTMIYDVRNQGPGFGQAQMCGGVKPVN